MALSYRLENEAFNALDEGVRGLYTEKDGAYVLGVDGLPDIPDVAGLKANNAAILSEKKKLEADLNEIKTTQANKEKEQAEKSNDFEALYNSSEKQRIDVEGQLTGLKTDIQNKDLNNASMRLASEMAEGKNIALLSTFLRGRLGHHEGDVKVLDPSGTLTVASMEDLKTEIIGSGVYDSLLKGNQSGGGGAAPNSSGGGAAGKEITRSELDTMSPVQKAGHFKSGGSVVDD